MATKKKQTKDYVELPDMVLVNGYEVNIRPMVGFEENGTNASGLYTEGSIMLSMNGEPQRIAMCLVHELLHACFDHSGMRNRYLNLNGHNAEEEIVSQLAFTLTEIIANDDRLVEFIKSAFNGKTIQYDFNAMHPIQKATMLRKRGNNNDRVRSKQVI